MQLGNLLCKQAHIRIFQSLQGMYMSLINKLLERPESIKEINDKYDYEDVYFAKNGDAAVVSCGQNGSYNELSYIYTTHLLPKVEAGIISKQAAIDALDAACATIEVPRKREDFYQFLSEELDVDI